MYLNSRLCCRSVSGWRGRGEWSEPKTRSVRNLGKKFGNGIRFLTMAEKGFSLKSSHGAVKKTVVIMYLHLFTTFSTRIKKNLTEDWPKPWPSRPALFVIGFLLLNPGFWIRIRYFCLDLGPDLVFKLRWNRIRFQPRIPDPRQIKSAEKALYVIY